MRKFITTIFIMALSTAVLVGCAGTGEIQSDTKEDSVTAISSDTESEPAAKKASEAKPETASTSSASQAEESGEPSIQWQKDTTGKYLDNDSVSSIICVQATHDTFARVLMYEKSKENGKNVWTQTLECSAAIGLDGLGQTTEENCCTPIGDFGIIEAFGIKENPGTRLKYVDITDDIYCCSDETAYNKIIDINDYPHECEGEHMIQYSPEYNYGFFLDYNDECVYGQGSAVFFHCMGAKPYTGACIAVDEEYMIQILKAVDSNTRVIIDYAPGEIPM